MENKKSNSIFFEKKNKRGWIEIVEAFVAVLLVAATILIVINSEYIEKADISKQVYKSQISILREVQTDDNLRTEILTTPDISLPIHWEDDGSDGETPFPANTKLKIEARTPSYLECKAIICATASGALCALEEEDKTKDIYSQSIIISATLYQTNVYRKLNLFCWTK